MNLLSFPDFLNRNIWQVVIVGCLVLIPLRILSRKLPSSAKFSKLIQLIMALGMIFVTLSVVVSIAIQVTNYDSHPTPAPCSQYQSIPVDPRSGFDPMAECLTDYENNLQP